MFSHELSLDLPLELPLELSPKLSSELSLQLPQELSFMRVSTAISTRLHVSGFLYSVPPTIHYFSFRCPYVAFTFAYVAT